MAVAVHFLQDGWDEAGMVLLCINRIFVRPNMHLYGQSLFNRKRSEKNHRVSSSAQGERLVPELKRRDGGIISTILYGTILKIIGVLVFGLQFALRLSLDRSR